MDKVLGFIINESASRMCEFEVIEDNGGRRLTAEGTVQEADETNRNGRIYRLEDLAREIVAPRQKELLRTKNMLGEAGHPLSKDLIRQQTIDPANTAVRFLAFWMDGNKVKARFKGTNNDKGEAFDLDLREGVLPAFSLRALGTVYQTPKGAVVNNLKMITYDYVIYPSHPGAYTEKIVTESAGLINNTKRIPENMDATKSFVSTFTNEEALNSIQNESAINYIKAQSANYSVLKEFYDLSKTSSIDLINENQIAITDTSVGTIVMNIEDYISKEIMTYRR